MDGVIKKNNQNVLLKTFHLIMTDVQKTLSNKSWTSIF